MPTAPDFAFATRRLDELLEPALAGSFDRMPVDAYITGTFRTRRLSRFRLADDALVHLPHGEFMQSSYVNRLLGNIRREYAELEDGLVDLPAFQRLLRVYAAFFAIGPETVMGVHQIRIRCSAAESGHPAPEGIHQDGFDHLGIFCVTRVAVAGGETRLYRDPQGEPVFARELEPGDAVFVNDRVLYHYTSPLQPRGADEGHRDVFVVTA